MYDFESRGFWSPERGMTREKYEGAPEPGPTSHCLGGTGGHRRRR